MMPLLLPRVAAARDGLRCELGCDGVRGAAAGGGDGAVAGGGGGGGGGAARHAARSCHLGCSYLRVAGMGRAEAEFGEISSFSWTLGGTGTVKIAKVQNVTLNKTPKVSRLLGSS